MVVSGGSGGGGDSASHKGVGVERRGADKNFADELFSLSRSRWGGGSISLSRQSSGS